MNRYYEQFCESAVDDNSLSFLPSFHTMYLKRFYELLESGQDVATLEPYLCNSLNRNLLYFFYGRPSYRIGDGTSTVDNGLYPVIIIISPEATKSMPISAVYPFDTGGFIANRYTGHINPSVYPVEEFKMPGNCNLPAHVQLYYKTNQNYVNDNPRDDLPSIDDSFFHMNNYWRLIRDLSTAEVDDRRSCLELHCDTSIQLGSEVVEAAVVPNSWADKQKVAELVQIVWDAELLTYDNSMKRGKPDDLVAFARKVAIDYMNTKGWI